MIIAGWQDMLLSLTWNRSYDMDSSMLILIQEILQLMMQTVEGGSFSTILE
jgi:hypothetical protein